LFLKRNPHENGRVRKKKKRRKKGKNMNQLLLYNPAMVPPSGYSLARKALAGHTQGFFCLSPSCLCYLVEFNLPCREEKPSETKKTLFLPFVLCILK